MSEKEMKNSGRKPGNNAGKRGRNNRKPDRRHDSSKPSKDAGYGEREVPVDSSNDWSWYASSERLLVDAASISYNDPLGSRRNPVPDYAVNNTRLITAETFPDSDCVPGVFNIKLAPTFGISTDSKSTLNVAANNLYTFVRHMNSGSKNYDAPDLMLYVMAVDSLYSCYAWMTRAYGVLRSYSQLNRYKPEAWLAAMNIDAQDFLNHIADFRYYINYVGHKINALCIPNVFPYIIRHTWMYSNIYSDGVSAKAQTYMYNPALFYKYNEYAETGGQLEPVVWGERFKATKWTFTTLTAAVDELLGAVIHSEDMNIMSGDIAKAYGGSNLIQVAQIAEDYMVTEEYNLEVLSQIQNATILDGADISSFTVTQDPSKTVNYLTFDPRFSASGAELMGIRRTITMPVDGVTPAMTMVATRLMVYPAIEAYSSTSIALGKYYNLDECGSEVAIGCDIFTYHETSSGGWTLDNLVTAMRPLSYSTTLFSEQVNTRDLVDELAKEMRVIIELEKFDYHPPICVGIKYLDTAESNKQVSYVATLSDYCNYAFVDKYPLAKMHQTALLSELNVPQRI